MFHVWRPLQIISLILVFCVICVTSIVIPGRQISPKTPKRRRRLDIGTPAVPFSVHIKEAIIWDVQVLLLVITISLQYCQSKVQKESKQFWLIKWYIIRQGQRKKFRIFAVLASLLINGAHANLGAGGTINGYKLWGSNHDMIAGEISKDLNLQHMYVDIVINPSTSVAVLYISTTKEPQVRLNEYPRCFSPDTDSVHFVLDTGVNYRCQSI